MASAVYWSIANSGAALKDYAKALSTRPEIPEPPLVSMLSAADDESRRIRTFLAANQHCSQIFIDVGEDAAAMLATIHVPVAEQSARTKP